VVAFAAAATWAAVVVPPAAPALPPLIANPLIATAEGAGLGLPLARRLTEAHGGHFHLASVLGRGTIAAITLPAERCVEAEAPRRQA